MKLYFSKCCVFTRISKNNKVFEMIVCLLVVAAEQEAQFGVGVIMHRS